MHVFNWRADGLDLKVDMSYEDRLEQEISVEQQALIWPASSLPKDHVGPVALVGSILTALLLSSIHAALSLAQTTGSFDCWVTSGAGKGLAG